MIRSRVSTPKLEELANREHLFRATMELMISFLRWWIRTIHRLIRRQFKKGLTRIPARTITLVLLPTSCTRGRPEATMSLSCQGTAKLARTLRSGAAARLPMESAHLEHQDRWRADLATIRVETSKLKEMSLQQKQT